MFLDENFKRFEAEVMQRIIEESLPESAILEEQYRCAKIVSREFTGFGFFTKFEVANKNLQIPARSNSHLGRVQAKIEGLEYGAGFVLFVKDGFISLLEGYCYGNEPWPDEITAYTLEYQ